MSDPKIYVAGHRGMVGSAIVRGLNARSHENIVTRSSLELDLRDQGAVREFFQKERPDQVYLAAAKVGGIYANNTYPAEFIYDNLMIQSNVIDAAYRSGVEKLLFLGSSCIYPKYAEQPIREEALLSGELEPTNEPYAIAKIAGIKMCESYNRQFGTDYRSVMPTNLYGPGDNFHPENSHVIPGLIRRFHQAKLSGYPHVTVWGSGTVNREFLHVDDMAAACVHVMDLPPEVYGGITEPMLSHLNVGTGFDSTIRELVDKVTEVVGFSGQIVWDDSMPDGTPRKLLSVERLHSTGWHATVDITTGLANTYHWYLDNVDRARR
jgi:GDP-L-fucose synthase